MQGLGYAVACVGPLGVGLLRTTTDGWGAPFAVLFVSLAVLLGAGVVACRPSTLEDQVRRPALVDA